MESICFNCASREFAHRIEECARNREDVTLWGVDYMPYPLDADGEPIHVGDVVAYEDNTRPKEVVRCRDCKRFSLDNSDHDYRSGWWCHRWNTDMVKPDGFCAWGERRVETLDIFDWR